VARKFSKLKMVHVDFTRIWWCELIIGAMPVYSMNMTAFCSQIERSNCEAAWRYILLLLVNLNFTIARPDQCSCSAQSASCKQKEGTSTSQQQRSKICTKTTKDEKLHLSFFVFSIRISTSCLKSNSAQVWLLDHMAYTAATSSKILTVWAHEETKRQVV
jgi:hypothetical protein